MTDVLVLRALGLGDLLTGIPALRGVRRRWPDARVTVAAPEHVARWLRCLDLADDVLPADGVRALPDRLAWTGRDHVAVNLHGRGPASHRLLLDTGPAELVAFAAPGVDHDGPAWDPAEHEVDRWVRLLRSAGADCSRADLRIDVPSGTPPARDAVVVHPGAASGSRRWPVARWGAVVAALLDEGHDVVLTGGEDEVSLCEAVVMAADRRSATVALTPGGRDRYPTGTVRNLAGVLPLDGLAVVVGHARLLLCGDTGVAHLGTALGTPSVLLFGPTAPSGWGPVIDLDRHVVLWHGDGSGDPHAEATDPALAAITVEEVLDAARPLLLR